MEYRLVISEPDIAATALLAAGAHERLTHEVGVLPTRSARDFAERLEYVVGNGTIVGQFAGRRLTGFLGAISIPDFRNAGPGCFGPDWCHGFAAASGLVGIGDASPTHTVRRAGPSDSEALVEPGARRRRTGAELLAALARTAQESGKSVVSVDFETANSEAYAFWLRWFTPLTVSLERRL